MPENLVQVGSENSIRIIVDNRLNAKNTLPLRQQIWGWRTYGGITRDIFILVTPRIWASAVEIRPVPAENLLSAVVSYKARIENNYTEPQRSGQTETDILSLSRFAIYSEIYDGQTGEVVARTSPIPIQPAYRKTVTSEFSFSLQNPKLWSPSSPDIYVAKLFITKDGEVIDEFDENIGIRRIVKDGSELVLNGSKLTLKGIVWREDHPSYGSAMTYDAIEKDIALIKRLGVNLIRVANSSPHPYVVNLCDRYGIFLMEDLPIWNIPTEILSKEFVQEEAHTMLREMIERDRNHPSVIAWGLADTFDSSDPQAVQCISTLHTLAKTLDSRFTYIASSMVSSDSCGVLTDLAGFNWTGSGAKEFAKALQQWKKNHPRQPVLVTRYGQEVEPENHNGYSDPMSLEAQARYYQLHYKVILDAGIAGSTAWTFADWHGDRPIMTIDTHNRYLYSMGLVTAQREKRNSFEVFRALLNGEKISALPIGNHGEMSPMIYLVVGMLLLLLVAYFYNSNRRFHENINRSLFRPYNFFADIRDQRFLSPIQTILLAFFISVTVAIVTSSVMFHFRDSKILDYVLTHFITWDSLKASISSFVWNPWQCMIALTACLLAKYFLFILIVFSLQLFTRQRIFFYHAFSVTVWSTLPVLLLVLVAMFLYRLLENETFVLPVIVFLTTILLWVVIRFLKSISIIYDITAGKVFIIGACVFIFLGGAVLAYYDFTQSTFAYYHFFVTMLQSAH
jgi:beta-galactosidase